MDQKVHILALQKKTYASPRENMDAVRDMLAQYKREKPDFLLLPEIFTCPYDNSQFPLFAQKDGDSVLVNMIVNGFGALDSSINDAQAAADYVSGSWSGKQYLAIKEAAWQNALSYYQSQK